MFMFGKTKAEIAKDNNNDNKLNLLAGLNRDILNHLFSFFGNRKDLHKVSRVCQVFNTVAKARLASAPIYYTVGLNIALRDHDGSMVSKRQPKELKKEVIDSIFKPEKLYLFKTENDALLYAKATYDESDNWMGDDIAHPAIYKVKYLGGQPAANWEEQSIKPNRSGPNQDLVIQIQSLQVANKDIFILTGQLKMENGILHNAFQGPIINFAEDEDLNPSSSTCTIS